MRPLFVFLSFCVLFFGCSHKPKSSGYSIGVDPSWYPLQVAGKENNLLAFTFELLSEIGKKEDLQIAVTRTNWNDLLWSLQNKKFDAVLSTLRPYTFYEGRFTFSQPFLKTGPVIILPKKALSKKIEGKEIGVIRGSSAALILQTTPKILLQGYDSVPAIFEALEDEQIDGAAIEVMIAQQYLRDLYEGKFKIASDPLDDEGLRLLTLHAKEKELMKRFDRGLAALKKSGEYEKLLQKWGLSPDGKEVAGLKERLSSFMQFSKAN